MDEDASAPHNPSLPSDRRSARRTGRSAGYAGKARSRHAVGPAAKPGSRHSRHLAKQSRRRRRTTWIVAVVVAAAAVIAGVLGWSAVDRGGGASPGSATTSNTSVAVGDGGTFVVRVLGADDGVAADVVVGAQGRPTVVLAFPAVTLIEGTVGFQPLDELLAKSDPAVGLDALGRLVGTRPAGVAEVTWAALRTALVSAGVSGDWPESLGTAQPKVAETVAQAFAALAAATAADAGGKALDDLPMKRAAAGVRRSLRALAAGPEVVAALPGKTVKGSDFLYYEPDAVALGRLLGAAPPEKAVSVEVQNGSGVVDIARKVIEAIAPMGYTMLPAKNADGFPDVAATRIFAAPDTLAEAARLRSVLKQGTVVKQESLPAGRIVVVVGKDLSAESLPKPGA